MVSFAFVTETPGWTKRSVAPENSLALRPARGPQGDLTAITWAHASRLCHACPRSARGLREDAAEAARRGRSWSPGTRGPSGSLPGPHCHPANPLEMSKLHVSFNRHSARGPLRPSEQDYSPTASARVGPGAQPSTHPLRYATACPPLAPLPQLQPLTQQGLAAPSSSWFSYEMRSLALL